jgi:hypothetical protein
VTQTMQGSTTASGLSPDTGGSRKGAITVGISALALLVSMLSIVFSLYALKIANDQSTTSTTQQTAEPSASNVVPAESETAIETPSASVPSATGTDAPLPTASANYTVSYEDKRLTLQPNAEDCGGHDRTVDLDQPVINVTSGGDLDYSPTYQCEGQPSLRFVSNKVATVVSRNATPQDCAQAIQLSPASQEIAASQDLVICTVTDGQGAPNEPARAKIARIVITGVGQEQKVALNVTAWQIPY